MGKVILFLRVSSLKQDLTSQELVARRMAHADGYTDADILPPIQYKESASQLGEEDRKGLQELYKTLEERNDIDAVYLTELSRASRIPKVLYAFRDFLLERKIQLVCGEPSFRLLNNKKEQDKMASLVFAIFGAFAEQEIIEKKERFARGKEQKALEGKYTGGNILFGYKIGDNKKLIIDYIDEEGYICGNAKIVQLIYNLYEDGFSQPKISKELITRGYDLQKIGLINHILTNESYTGEQTPRKIIKAKSRINGELYDSIKHPRIYPQIISRAQFTRCRQIAKDNNKNLSKAKKVYYADHLMKCVTCGSIISASGSKNCYHCYCAYISEYQWKHDYYNKKKCENKTSISINVLDSLLWFVAIGLEAKFMLEADEKNIIEIRNKIADLQTKISAVEQRLAKVETKKKRTALLFANDDIDEEEFNKLREKQESERIHIRNEKQEFLEQIARHEDAIATISEGYIKKREEIKKAKENNDQERVYEALREYWDAKTESELKIYSSISMIKNDKARFDIIHRQIESVTMEKVEVYYRYRLVWKKTTAKRISIYPQKYFKDNVWVPECYKVLIISQGGKGSRYLDENENIDVIYESAGVLDDDFGYVKYKEDGDINTYQVMPVEYLYRFDDEGKRERREKEKQEGYKGVEGHLRIEDIMSRTNLTYGQVYSAINNGILKAQIVRHKCFIAPDDAERYICRVNEQRASKGDRLSAFEIAKRFNLNYNYVLRRVKKGKLISEYVAGEYLISLEDAEKYFASDHEEKKGRDMDGYLSAATVAKKYGISYKSIRKKIRLGEIPSTKRKGYYYIDPKDVEEYFGISGLATDDESEWTAATEA